jgi:phosphoglycolate phosphatase
MEYKAVIFDFDNTLVASWEQNFAHHKYIGKKHYGFDFKDEDIKKHYGKPYYQLLKDLYEGRDTIENILKNIISVRDNFLKKEYEYSRLVLETLFASGIPVGVVSATNKRHLVEDFTRLKFPYNKFFIMQASDEVDFHKPDPRVFNEALKKLESMGVRKENVVYIGDSIDDLESSQGAGMDFIALTTGLYSEEDFKKAGAKIILKDIRELLDFI